MHAYALELLAAQAAEPTANILDVGCGSGYLTAVFARYNPTAFVVGIDYFEDQVNLSKTNIAKKVHFYMRKLSELSSLNEFHHRTEIY
jgi:protein-L-isoaspartate(D-aspartate) O-methyltransferase